jgi:hypothetical protein
MVSTGGEEDCQPDDPVQFDKTKGTPLGGPFLYVYLVPKADTKGILDECAFRQLGCNVWNTLGCKTDLTSFLARENLGASKSRAAFVNTGLRLKATNKNSSKKH